LSFSQHLWQANLSLFEDTLSLPFNQQLAEGMLSRSRFRHYIIQDAHYLLAYGRALAVTAAKAFDAAAVVQFTEAAKEAIVVERSLHDGIMREFAISPTDFSATELTPACHHYCSYLLATAWSQPYPVAVAALLPCFWIYAEVGRAIHARSAPNNPYQNWIDTYASEDFQGSVKAVCATVDSIAEHCADKTLADMRQAYRQAARLEWLFWDSAFHEADWPMRG